MTDNPTGQNSGPVTRCSHLMHLPSGKCLGCGEQHQPLADYKRGDDEEFIQKYLSEQAIGQDSVTEAMVEAGVKAYIEAPRYCDDVERFTAIYLAMSQASPPPQIEPRSCSYCGSYYGQHIEGCPHDILPPQNEVERPFAYAYRYPAWPPEGATVIRFGTGGREINGAKPVETIPLYTRAALTASRMGGDDD